MSARTTTNSAPWGMPIIVTMVRNATARALVALGIVLALLVNTSNTAELQPAATERDPVAWTLDSQFADWSGAVGDMIEHGFGFWFRCKGVAWWEPVGQSWSIHLEGGCTRGFTMGDLTLNVRATAGCADFTARFGNVDDDETRPFDRDLLTSNVGPLTGCDPVTELCFWDEGAPGNSEGAEQCVPVLLGLPPAVRDASNTPQTGCALWSPLVPWVSGPTAVTVSGGWAWQYQITATMLNSSATAGYNGGRLSLDGTLVKGKIGFQTVGAGSPVVAAADGEGNVGGGIGGWWTAMPGTDGQRIITARGPVKSTAIGTGAVDFQLSGVGFWWDGLSAGLGGVPNTVDQTPKSWTARPAVSQLDGAAGELNTYGGHNDPGRCHYWWGQNVFSGDTSGYAAPAGPLVLQNSPTPPAYTPPVASPTVYVGPSSGCAASGSTVCVDPDDGAPTDPLPDPDMPECDLSPWDPATYPNQVECAVARIVQVMVVSTAQILGLLQQILAALAGGVGSGADDLEALLLPPEGMWSDAWSDLSATWTDSGLGDWSDSLGALLPNDPGDGDCQGPGVGPVGIAEGVEIPEIYPLSACDDPQAAIAPKVKAVLAVGVTLGGAWRIWDMMAGSLGAYRGGGRHMSESEWL